MSARAYRTAVVFAACTLFSTSTLGAPASGAVLANTCYSCHGTDGRSRGDMPTIAGKSKSFIVDRLKAFKSGERPSTVMGRIAKGFSDEEIVSLAQHFAGK